MAYYRRGQRHDHGFHDALRFGRTTGAAAATLVVLPTVLKFSGCDGFDIWDGASAINMQNVCIVGDGTAGKNGISLQDLGRLNFSGVLAIAGFGGYGLYANLNSECNGGSCSCAAATANSG